ncbi:acyltransferase [Prevotella sp. 20925_1_30]|uniref:acyltransferase family protein n=1 Tax=Prevotella sp. 20925_1_30 TaxID=3003679 RepID=UPI00352F52E3
MIEKKERNSNIELYRIIVMLLIVMHHYVVNSGLLDEMFKTPLAPESVFLYLFGMWGKTGINCFVLITGYFMCKSSISLRKFVKLLLQIELYNILFGCIFLYTGHISLSVSSLIQIVNPIPSVNTGFTSCFLLFYLFIPFLNILLNNLSKSQHLLLVILCLGIYTILGTVPWISVTLNYITWFCILYVVASYIRVYGIWRSEDKMFWGGASLVLITISVLSVLMMLSWGISSGVRLDWSLVMFFVSDSNKLLAFLVSISTFMFIKNIHIRQSKWINTIASCTFGVLLIHANSDAMRQWLWKETCDNVGFFNSSMIYVHALCVPIIVFIACTIIDFCRQHFLERFYLDLVVKYIQSSKLYITYHNRLQKYE